MANSDARMWFVRSGRSGIYAEHFLDASVVAIGWGEVGEIPNELSDRELLNRFREVWPHDKPRTRQTWAAQVKRFLRTIEVGDLVVTYDPVRLALTTLAPSAAKLSYVLDPLPMKIEPNSCAT